MKLILPIPPSVNALTRNVVGDGRKKTKRYMEWINAAGWDVKIQRQKLGMVEPFLKPVKISIALSTKSGLDLDNCCKPTIDLLVAHYVIPDDQQAYVGDIRLSWQSEDDKLHVTVEPIEQQEAA